MRRVKKKNILYKIKEDATIKKKYSDKKSSEKARTKENSVKIKNSKDSNLKKDKHNIKIKTTKKKKRSFWKKLLTAILILGIICILSVTAFLGYIVITAPEFNESALTVKDQTVVYDISGNIITTLGTEKRESVTYDELPQVLIDAIIATEDSRFFEHNGVDLLRFFKATILQLMGRDEGGASTLTMQVVKNNITKKDEIERNVDIKDKIKKVIRKFQDVYISVFKVEKKYSKEEILELYVNDNFLGGSYYGVQEASKYYFGKDVGELSLPEASLLAGLFQLPGKDNPYVNAERATKRRNIVLDLMVRHNYITEEEKELAKKVTVESMLVGTKNEGNAYQGYIDTVVAEISDLTGDNPYTVPMKIYTTMERSIQDGVNKVFTGNGWYWKDDYVQGGVAIVNAQTGAIAAVGAGRNKTGVNQFNYATMAKRQPGSTAKPLFDYGPGIEYNNFSSYQLFMDEPWTYTNGPSVNNWDGGFMGLITARYALQVSRNIPALKAFQIVGAKNSQKFVYSLGLDVALNSSSENYRIVNESTGVDNTINEAYSIGGVAEGFTPLEMASAYAAFANGGYYTTPYTVTKIEYRETGEVKEFKNQKERVMKDSTAYIINNILESAVTGGFPGGARVQGSHVAAKTGTSNFNDYTMKKYGLPSWAVNDLWTVAYTSQYSVAVWYGYDEVTSKTYNTDGKPKDALMSAVISYIPKDTRGWSMPSSVVAVEVEKESWPAKLPSQYTPADMRTTEYFVRGTQPTEVSERYGKLSDIKNTSTTKNGNSVTIKWSYDTPTVLTDEYLQKYFSNSVFGKSKAKLIEARKKYNNSVFGNVGFGIYRQDGDELTFLDFTTDTSYTYQGYGNVTLVVKAEYEKFKSNASSGTKFDINLGELVTDKLKVTLKGTTNVSTNVGTYVENGIKSITYGNIDVSSSATITYKLTAADSTTTSYTSAKDLENYINTLPAGSYTIIYNVVYLGMETNKARNLTLR